MRPLTVRDHKNLCDLGENLSRKEQFEQTDLAIFHETFALKAAKKADKSIFYDHTASREITFLSKFFEKRLKPLEKKAFRKNKDQLRKEIKSLLLNPDKIIVNSYFIQSQYKEFFDMEPDVIHPPIDFNKFEAKESEGDYFLSVQRISWNKKILEQVKAFEELNKKLIIVGEGRMSSELESITREIQNVEYRGRVGQDELSTLYQDAKAVIQTGRKEDWGYVPREALASGTPVIVPREGGFKDLERRGDVGEFYEREEDSESLREAVNRFSNDYNAKNLREKVSDLSKNNIKKEWESAIKEVLSS